MSQHHPELLAEIEAFIAAKGMTETAFGRRAMSDPHFVRDVRGARRLWPHTVEKVRNFMSIFCHDAPGLSPGNAADLTAAQQSEAA